MSTEARAERARRRARLREICDERLARADRARRRALLREVCGERSSRVRSRPVTPDLPLLQFAVEYPEVEPDHNPPAMAQNPGAVGVVPPAVVPPAVGGGAGGGGAGGGGAGGGGAGGGGAGGGGAGGGGAGGLTLAGIQILLRAVQDQGAALQVLAQNLVDQNAGRIPREIEAALPVFSGRADEDVDEFIGAFTRIQLQEPRVWVDARLRQMAVGRLMGLAQEWQDRMGHAVADWPAWSAALRAAFRRTLGLLEWGQLMEGRTQGVGEPGSLYALAKMRIAQRCPHALPNAELVYHLIRGLHNREEAAALLGNPPADGPTFITRITELETIRGPPTAAPVPAFPSLVYPGRPEPRGRVPPPGLPPTFAPPLGPPPAVPTSLGTVPDPTAALTQMLARLPELIESSVTRALRSNVGTRSFSPREPPGRRPSSGGAPPIRGPIVCYRCDREGHIARDCAERAGNGRAGGSAAGH
jgi:Zinc knuckle